MPSGVLAINSASKSCAIRDTAPAGAVSRIAHDFEAELIASTPDGTAASLLDVFDALEHELTKHDLATAPATGESEAID